MVLIVFILLGFIAYFNGGARIWGNKPIDAIRLSSLVNDWRYNNYLQPFKKNDKLCGLALTRANQIIKDWSHSQFIPEERKIVAPGTVFGENLAKDYQTEEEVLNGWLNSPPHRKVLANLNYTQMCIACENSYCALELSGNF